jgi:hypothetical protein
VIRLHRLLLDLGFEDHPILGRLFVERALIAGQ